MASRPSTRIAFLALLVFLWSWPSLFFLPVVLGRDSTGLSLTSAFLTVGIGVVVVSASMLVAGRGETRSWMIYCSIGVAVGIFVIVIPSYLLGVEAGVLGGLGTAFGAFVGAMIVGVLIETSAQFIPSDLKYVGALLVMIIILFFRPQGILGRRERIG